MPRYDLYTKDAIYSMCVSCLPSTPDSRFWFDGEEVLCETEQQAENLADFFDTLYGGATVNTGYYDPDEDERNGETNDHTGWYYVTIN